MRLLLLISTIAIGTSFLTSSSSVFAASTAKAKTSHSGGRGSNSHNKAKGQLKPKEDNPGDVWKRIGFGLRLPALG